MLPTHTTAGIIFRNGKVLIGQRSPKCKHGAGYWEFPGGKREKNENLGDCMVRELKEELGVKVIIKSCICVPEEHRYKDGDGKKRALQVFAFLCKIVGGKKIEPKPLVHSELRWVTVRELFRFLFIESDVPIVYFLQSYKFD